MARADSRRPIALGDQSGRPVAIWLIAAVVGALALMAVFAWFWRSVDQRVDVVPSDLPPAAISIAAPEPSHPVIGVQTYQELLSNRSNDWRLARLAENPKILVIEFPSLAAQGRALNRLAALIEKNKAPRDRVLGDEGLAKFIQQGGDTAETFYFGHDYPAEAVARFYTLAGAQQMLLNADELRLGNELLAAGVLKEEADKLVANPDRQAVVTFTAEQADDPLTKANEAVDAQRRETTLRHELSHGEFFTNAAYREHCWKFWQQLSDADRSQLRKFLADQGYDPRNEEVMVNETQAYLMHTPDARTFSAEQLGISPAKLAKWRVTFNLRVPVSIFTSIER